MNKIIEVALAGKFTADAVPSVLEVIMATPNPTMATEILLGVYEEVKLETVVMDSRGCIKTMFNVNHWTGTVEYSFQEVSRKSIYVDENLDTDILTIENMSEYEKAYEDDNTKTYWYPTGEFRDRTSSCSINDWMKLTPHQM
jgi:hypothetical protein